MRAVTQQVRRAIMKKLFGAAFAMLGFGLIVLTTVLLLLPRKYALAEATVVSVKDEKKATLSYTVDGTTYTAYMEFRDPVVQNTSVDIAYKRSDPGIVQHPRISRKTIALMGFPGALVLMLMGFALVS